MSDVVAGALMKRGKVSGMWQEVIFPDGRNGFIDKTMVEDYRKWRLSRKLDAEHIEEFSKLFPGVPYLWGGTSAKGFDCSGRVRINSLDPAAPNFEAFWLNTFVRAKRVIGISSIPEAG